MKQLIRIVSVFSFIAPMSLAAAALDTSNIDTRTTTNDLHFSDLTFSNASNNRSDLLNFHGTVGDSGTFGIVGFQPDRTISTASGAGIAVSNLQPANSAGTVFYTATIIGTTDLTLRQSWVNIGTLTVGTTPTGLHYLDFFGRNAGFLRAGGVFDYSVSIPGNWSSFGTSTGQVDFLGINPDFKITKNFIYDPSIDRTFIEAVNTNYNINNARSDLHFVLFGQPVPEPSTTVMLALGLAGLFVFDKARRLL